MVPSERNSGLLARREEAIFKDVAKGAKKSGIRREMWKACFNEFGIYNKEVIVGIFCDI